MMDTWKEQKYIYKKKKRKLNKENQHTPFDFIDRGMKNIILSWRRDSGCAQKDE